MGQTALLPLRRKVRWGFFFSVLNNPTASVGFEPANLGTKVQHATSRPLKPLWRNPDAFVLYFVVSIKNGSSVIWNRQFSSTGLIKTPKPSMSLNLSHCLFFLVQIVDVCIQFNVVSTTLQQSRVSFISVTLLAVSIFVRTPENLPSPGFLWSQL